MRLRPATPFPVCPDGLAHARRRRGAAWLATGTEIRARLLPGVLVGAIALTAQLSWCPPASAQDPGARTVLTIHWGAEEFPGTITLDSAIRDVLLAPSGTPVNYYAEYLESEVFPAAMAASALHDYIARKFEGRRIDAVIANTTPALQFALDHRQALFPGAPIVFSAGTVPDEVARHEVTGVTGVVNDGVFGDTLELALKLHPSVRKVLVVAQSRSVYGYDRRVRSALDRFTRRVELTYVPQQSLSGVLAAVKAAPPTSLILFGRYIPDGAGSNMHSREVLRLMAEVSPVPIYATTDHYVGTGVVGGMMQGSRATGRRLGELTRQILGGVQPDRIPIENLPLEPTFDWRQLRRWNIDTANLPPGSDVRFRTATVWELYHRYIVGTMAVFVVQAVLITGLLTQRARRRHAERTIRAGEATLRTSYEQIRQMAGRLINAQEAARAGVAQDLHDDVCQQLVFVSMGVSTLKSSSGQLQDAETQRALATLEADTQKVFEGLRRLSQDLHPATLRLLGLAAALRAHCAEMAKHHGVEVAFRAEAVPPNVHKDVAVCFFRIAQEALRNGIAHGGARRLSVSLAGSGEHLDLIVTDDGAGFDLTSVQSAGGGLGLVTMNERARVVGATVDIVSQPGRGTMVQVRGPAELPGQGQLAEAVRPA
jgi:signal transduction histidine kinase